MSQTCRIPSPPSGIPHSTPLPPSVAPEARQNLAQCACPERSRRVSAGWDSTRNPKRRRRDTFFSPNTTTHHLQSQRLLVRMIGQRENADRNEQSKLAREEDPTLCKLRKRLAT